eukprot:CAMPEP_0178977794 /NCGR_PEP_ID=MMETSP0789-20121207/24736_1 /TAXON_ID=3005 /ORGANISM="Rhizosolenia setigera, Strain CCMP 1694" /LENGTH=841 /DNA_ID=CAMNT_0020667331 /DNA_START=28 /DNA_END=2550 /DNA_ORIENTATION=-
MSDEDKIEEAIPQNPNDNDKSSIKNVPENNCRKKKKFYVIGGVLLFFVVIATITLSTFSFTKTVRKRKRTLGPELSSAFENRRFSVSLPKFDPSILSGYSQCDNLIYDIEESLKDFSNELILEELSYEESLVFSPTFRAAPMVMMSNDSNGRMPVAVPTSAKINTEKSAKDSSASFENAGEDSFGTNNQVAGVEEADIVKSDGTHVFTVYGTDIVTLDTQGNELSRLSLLDDIKLTQTPTPTPGQDENEDDGNNKRSLKSIPYYHDPIPRVNGLIMYGNRLVAFVSNNDMRYNYLSYTDSNAVVVVIMDIGADDGKLTIVEHGRVKGKYQAARSMDQNVHLVTTSRIDTFDLGYSLRRWRHDYDTLNDKEYLNAAFDVAEATIPKIAEQLVHDLISSVDDEKSGGGSRAEYDPESCRHIARVSNYKYGRDLENASELSKDSDPTGGSGSLNGFVRIMSFDVMSSSPGEVLSNAHLTGSFVPTSYADIYASQDKLFLGGRGYQKDPASHIWKDYTYVTAFDLTGASASPLATGILPGYTLNQFSFDFYNDHLRVATSTSANRRWNHENGSFDVFAESTNQVLVSEIKDGSINIVGELTGLGPTERVYAVRFLADRGFVVTFQQIDPFYTLDLTDPTKPTMMGELKIPGFSNYLHPVDDDYILAIGQDADEMGRTTGLQVALFDVSDMSNPEQIAKYVVEGSSYSSAQNDHYAFRYLPVSRKLIIPLSWYDWDPVTGRYSSDSFDGFHVYNIDPHAEEIVDAENNEKSEKITLDFEVSHYREEESRYCYGMANLSPRSLVFAGDLMTMKSHSVNVNTISSKTLINAVNLDENRNATICVGWWW